ncbi:MAG: hypothetical protein ACE5JC_00395 [Candidatus Zixiibacteriota bacterium]
MIRLKEMEGHCKVNVVTIATFVAALFAIAVSIYYFWPKVFPPPDIQVRLATPPTCQVKTLREGGYQYRITASIALGARKGELFEVDSVWVESEIGTSRLKHHGSTRRGFRWPIVEMWRGSVLITTDKKVKKIEGCIKAQTNWGVGSTKFEMEKINWD